MQRFTKFAGVDDGSLIAMRLSARRLQIASDFLR